MKNNILLVVFLVLFMPIKCLSLDIYSASAYEVCKKSVTSDFSDQAYNSNGYWNDIKYEDLDSGWGYAAHLQRILNQVYLGKNLESIHKKILFVKKSKKSKNWWYNEVFYRKYMACISIGNSEAKDFVGQIEYVDPRTRGGGANLAWLIEINLLKFIAEKNINALLEEAGKINDLLLSNGEDGFHDGGLFLQHGGIIYNGSYGANYVETLVNIIKLIDDNRIKNDLLKINLQKYIDNGFCDFLYKDWFDWSIRGRTIARKKELNSAVKKYKYAANFLNHNCTDGPKSKMFVDFGFAFFKSDDFYFSVKIPVDKSPGAESFNGEGIDHYWRSHGFMTINSYGLRYDENILNYNWFFVPGVTSAKESNYFHGVSKFKVERPIYFDGGNFKVISASFAENFFEVKKTWLIYGRELFFLASRVISSKQVKNYFTTIDQFVKDEDYYFDGKSFLKNAGVTYECTQGVMNVSDFGVNSAIYINGSENFSCRIYKGEKNNLIKISFVDDCSHVFFDAQRKKYFGINFCRKSLLGNKVSNRGFFEVDYE